MHKTVEEINSTKRRFTIEIPAEVIEERIIETLKDLKSSVKIPGFRPGKAPLSLVDRKYGKEVESDVVQKIIPEYYAKVLNEEELVPVTPPIFEYYDFKRHSPLKMTFTVEFRPKVENLKYEGFIVKDEKIEVTEDDVKEAIEVLRFRNATLQEMDKDIQDNDIVLVEYEVVEENEKVENQFIKIGSDVIPMEISNSLKGKKKGESFEIKVTFPDDYINKNFAGGTFTLKGAIKEVYILKIPELNEEFAKKLGYESVEDMENKAKEAVKFAKEFLLQEKQKEEIIKQLLEKNEIDVPDSVFQSELADLVAKKRQENPTVDIEKLKNELKEKAIIKSKAKLLLEIIADKESLKVTDEEIKDKIIQFSNNIGIEPNEFVKLYLPDKNALHRFIQSMRRDKALDYLLKKAEKRTEESEEEVK